MSQKQSSSCGSESFRELADQLIEQAPSLRLDHGAGVMRDEIDDDLVPPVGPEKPSTVDRVEPDLDEVWCVSDVVERPGHSQQMLIVPRQMDKGRRPSTGRSDVPEAARQCGS